MKTIQYVGNNYISCVMRNMWIAVFRKPVSWFSNSNNRSAFRFQVTTSVPTGFVLAKSAGSSHPLLILILPILHGLINPVPPLHSVLCGS